jgi:NAD(P)-dependent dehydrogenase (short-subunit alcohol dehydrogenase family)
MLITSAPSGMGKEVAKVFAADGWNVVATMRSPA